MPYRDSTLTQLLRSSLTGQSCTSVVIAVASDREHGDESKCSLSFGQRMQGMRTNAAVVGATNGGDGAAAMQRELATARRDLAAMEANGYAEHFGKDAMAGEVRLTLSLTLSLTLTPTPTPTSTPNPRWRASRRTRTRSRSGSAAWPRTAQRSPRCRR